MLSKKFIDCVLVAIHAFSLLEKVFNCSNRAIKLSAVPRRKRAGVIKQAFQVLCNLQAQLLRLRHMNIYPIMMPFVEPAYETNDVISTIMRRKTYFFLNDWGNCRKFFVITTRYSKAVLSEVQCLSSFKLKK